MRRRKLRRRAQRLQEYRTRQHGYSIGAASLAVWVIPARGGRALLGHAPRCRAQVSSVAAPVPVRYPEACVDDAPSVTLELIRERP